MESAVAWPSFEVQRTDGYDYTLKYEESRSFTLSLIFNLTAIASDSSKVEASFLDGSSALPHSLLFPTNLIGDSDILLWSDRLTDSSMGNTSAELFPSLLSVITAAINSFIPVDSSGQFDGSATGLSLFVFGGSQDFVDSSQPILSAAHSGSVVPTESDRFIVSSSFHSPHFSLSECLVHRTPSADVGSSGTQLSVTSTWWIPLVAAIGGLLLIGLLAGLLIVSRRGNKPELPPPEKDNFETSVTFTDDLTAEMECENPLVSDGDDNSGNDEIIDVSPDPDEML
jgi:hypothetical protein